MPKVSGCERATLKDAQKFVSSLGFSLRKVEKEYQVKPKNSPWDDSKGDVYFTEDLGDVIDTVLTQSKMRQP